LLEERLRDYAGVLIEDKQLSLSVHYRAAEEKVLAHRAILEVAEALRDVRVVGGKDVVNLVPRGAAHKGFALDELRRGAGCETSMYVGDDETDEDVFRMRRAHPIFTVRVGANRSSAAEYYLREQTEVDHLIGALLELRRCTNPVP
jgi:trehalose 6-phosphate phosphatase